MLGIVHSLRAAIITDGRFQVPVRWFQLEHILRCLNGFGVVLGQNGYFEECSDVPVIFQRRQTSLFPN